MQPQSGGKFYLRLNSSETPIANKYSEGKMKRTLKRESKSAWNCREGSEWGPAMRASRMWNGPLGDWSAARLSMQTVVGRAGGPSPVGRSCSWIHRQCGCGNVCHLGVPLRTPACSWHRPVGSSSNPSWNTDQGVWHACEPTGVKTQKAPGSWWAGSPLWGTPSTDRNLLWRFRVGACLSGPERWWTMPERGEAGGNSGGGP